MQLAYNSHQFASLCNIFFNLQSTPDIFTPNHILNLTSSPHENIARIDYAPQPDVIFVQ